MKALMAAAVGLALFLVGVALTVARMQVDGWTVLAAAGVVLYGAAVVAVKREAVDPAAVETPGVPAGSPTVACSPARAGIPGSDSDRVSTTSSTPDRVEG